jgi:N,N'-diacetyllegionaminate synthase
VSNFKKSFKVDGKPIGDGYPASIIAEAGVNHFGDLKKAYQLIDLACEAKADFFKIQHYKTENLVGSIAPEWIERLKEKELTDDSVLKIRDKCNEKGISFLCTAHEQESLEFLDKELNVPAFKIGSGEVDNWEFIEDIASRGKPVILSTGMYQIEQIKQVIDVIHKGGCTELCILHCVTNYPAKDSNINLDVIRQIKDLFEGPIGYSDHTTGIAIPLASIALGANVLEKHITIDKNVPNSQDWKVSCDQSDFYQLVHDVRRIENSLGGEAKKISSEEMASIDWARKSITSVSSLSPGDIITKNSICMQRPGTGIPGSELHKVIGRTIVEPIAKGRLITWDHIK